MWIVLSWESLAGEASAPSSETKSGTNHLLVGEILVATTFVIASGLSLNPGVEWKALDQRMGESASVRKREETRARVWSCCAVGGS